MYIIIEIQSNGENVSTLVTVKETRNDAESVYHSVLAAAAISSVEKHSAVLLTSEGKHIMSQVYYHTNEGATE